jgi:hypothetical protein
MQQKCLSHNYNKTSYIGFSSLPTLAAIKQSSLRHLPFLAITNHRLKPSVLILVAKNALSHQNTIRRSIIHPFLVFLKIH